MGTMGPKRWHDMAEVTQRGSGRAITNTPTMACFQKGRHFWVGALLTSELLPLSPQPTCSHSQTQTVSSLVSTVPEAGSYEGWLWLCYLCIHGPISHSLLYNMPPELSNKPTFASELVDYNDQFNSSANFKQKKYTCLNHHKVPGTDPSGKNTRTSRLCTPSNGPFLPGNRGSLIP